MSRSRLPMSEQCLIEIEFVTRLARFLRPQRHLARIETELGRSLAKTEQALLAVLWTALAAGGAGMLGLTRHLADYADCTKSAMRRSMARLTDEGVIVLARPTHQRWEIAAGPRLLPGRQEAPQLLRSIRCHMEIEEKKLDQAAAALATARASLAQVA